MRWRVWVTRLDETMPRVESAFRPAGGDWSRPVIVSRYSTDARVAMDARGNAVAVWTRHDPNDASTEWIETANRPPTGPGAPPSRCPSPMPSNRTSLSTLRATHWRCGLSSTTPATGCSPRTGRSAGHGAPPSTSPQPGKDSRWPEVALDGRGGAVAVWIRRIPGEEAVQTADRLADGSWSDPVTLSIEGGTAEDPELDVGSQGDAVVTLHRIPDYPFGLRIQAADRAAGGRWGGAVNLSGEDVAAERPDVAIDRWGNATARVAADQRRRRPVAGRFR